MATSVQIQCNFSNIYWLTNYADGSSSDFKSCKKKKKSKEYEGRHLQTLRVHKLKYLFHDCALNHQPFVRNSAVIFCNKPNIPMDS